MSTLSFDSEKDTDRELEVEECIQNDVYLLATFLGALDARNQVQNESRDCLARGSSMATDMSKELVVELVLVLVLALVCGSLPGSEPE